MNKIEELIQQFCPDGVVYKELNEVVNLTMGTSPAGSTFSSNPEDGIEFHQGKTLFGNEIIKHSPIYTTSPIKIAEPDSLIMSVRAPVGDTNLTNRKIAIGRGLCSMVGKDDIMTKFLYYFINVNIQKFKNKSNGSTFEAINTNDIKKFPIPVPPLPIQQEIVTILDSFTQLEAELEAELEARRAQYKYYRDQLLCFEGKEVEWKTLGEVAKILRGTAITKKETNSGKIPVVANSPGPVYFHSESNRSGETIVIARSGAYSGLVSYWNESFFLTDAFSIHPDIILMKTKFVYYFLKNEQGKIHNMKKGSGVPHVRAKDFESYIIPIPPIEEQERIVGILDKFDALVNDISVGLPAEIEARRKQYEYYRKKLLNFKKYE